MGLFGKDRDLTQPQDRVELLVDASALGERVEDVSIRLDSFLARHLKWRSRSSLKELVRDGWVYVDASTPERPEGTGELKLETRSGRKLRHGSRVVIVIPPENRQAPPEDIDTDLTVLYELALQALESLKDLFLQFTASCIFLGLDFLITLLTVSQIHKGFVFHL